MEPEAGPGVGGSVQIEVYADLWCPFTHVGLRVLRSMRETLGRPRVGIRVRPWPLELVNGAPMEPAKAAANAAALRAQVAPGLFSSLDVITFPTSTLEGLALVEAAYGASQELGERASFILRDLLFEEGRDISDPAVLEAAAQALEIGSVTDAHRAAVRASLAEGSARGVIGSPHFFCGSEDIFCPSLEITRDDGMLQIRDGAVRLEAFLASCLGAPG
jgi:predicted DsbA family dithiol-disulfide isomerase